VTAVRLLWPGPSTRTRALAVQTLVTVILHAGAATGLPAIPGYATMEHTLGQVRWAWLAARARAAGRALALDGIGLLWTLVRERPAWSGRISSWARSLCPGAAVQALRNSGSVSRLPSRGRPSSGATSLRKCGDGGSPALAAKLGITTGQSPGHRVPTAPGLVQRRHLCGPGHHGRLPAAPRPLAVRRLAVTA
jgi:hypothetical protein